MLVFGYLKRCNVYFCFFLFKNIKYWINFYDIISGRNEFEIDMKRYV